MNKFLINDILRRISRWILFIGVLFAALWIWNQLFHGVVYDDAYIAFRYSDNWAAGHGLRWNPGEQPVEGFTSFLWVFIGAAIEYILNIPPHISMIFIGIASWLILVGFVVPLIGKRIAPEQSGLSRKIQRVAIVVTVLITPQVALGAFHGMETTFFILILALVTLSAIKTEKSSMRISLIIASAAAFMTRPDAITFIIPLWIILFVLSDSTNRPACFRDFAIFALIIAVYTVIKWYWSGYPLPNTFYIKHSSGLPGGNYVSTYLSVLLPLWFYLAFVSGKIGVRKLIGDRHFLLLVIPSLFYCFSYIFIIPSMGHAFRFLIPTWPFILLGALRADVLSNNEAKRSDASLLRTIPSFISASALFLLAITLSTLNSWRYMKHEYKSIVNYCDLTRSANVAGGKRLSRAALLTPAPVLATGDIGALAYFSKLKTVDLIGLADAKVAHFGLTHEYFSKSCPDIIVLQDLFLRNCPDESKRGDVELTIDGERRWLDSERYVFENPAHEHNGLGSTYQVVTTQIFSESYAHVGYLPIGSKKGYPVFIRRNYDHFTELVLLLSQNGKL